MASCVRHIVICFAGLVITACAKPSEGGNDDTGSSSSGAAAMTTSSTAAPTSGSESSTGGLPQGHGCCAAHDGPGCDEAAVQTCVCDERAECCTFDWDEGCVEQAMTACAPTCMPDPAEGSSSEGASGPAEGSDEGSTGEPAPPNDGPCCESVELGAGCGDMATADCVCARDPFCCDESWDNYCVAEAAQLCEVDCMNDCCLPHTTDSCNDVDVFDCVLRQNDSCWDEWTMDCVDVATMECGLMCG